MKQLLGLLAVAALAACSSGTGANGVQPPPTKTFSFGSATPVTTGSAQSTTADDAQTQSGQIITAATTTGSTASASAAPELAITLTSEALPAARGTPTPTPHLSSAELVSKLRAGTRGSSLAANCYTETANALTYNNCDCSASTAGYTCHINGSLTATNDEVKWNITIDISYTGSGSTVVEAGTLSGDITVVPTQTGGTINGFAKEGISATAQGNGSSEYFAYTAEVDFKTMVWDNSCNSNAGGFTSGQLEIARTVATSGNYTAPYSDAAVLFTWNGCGTLSEATGN